MKLYLTFLLSLSVFLVSSSCAKPEHHLSPSRKTAATSDLPPVEQGEIWGTEEENETQEVISVILKTLAEQASTETFIPRDAHPKHHGCVKAFFNVDPSALPAELRTGVFSTSTPVEYPAWIRFSNGNPKGLTRPDIKKDIRGMAIKLMGVPNAPTGSQDFVMCTAREFFTKNASEYVEFNEAVGGSSAALLSFGVRHIHDMRILLGAETVPANPLQSEYYSALPYKLGATGSMKFEVHPCVNQGAADPAPEKGASPNYLRERLVSTLAGRSACFDFFVQPNTDPASQPIENPTLAWKVTPRSPLIKVATITIPVQSEIDSPPHLNFCENISFDPWRGLPGTRPLGQISRMRHEIYPAVSEYRHQSNHIPQVEPKSHEICTGDTAAMCATPKRE